MSALSKKNDIIGMDVKYSYNSKSNDLRHHDY